MPMLILYLGFMHIINVNVLQVGVLNKYYIILKDYTSYIKGITLTLVTKE